jgi:hypothetical protein
MHRRGGEKLYFKPMRSYFECYNFLDDGGVLPCALQYIIDGVVWGFNVLSVYEGT